MEINNDDIKIFQSYVNSLFSKQLPINLLINSNICNNNLDFIDISDINIYINNIQKLLNYLKEQHIFIKNWKLKSNYNLLYNNNLYNILILFNNYFNEFNEQGYIYYENNYIYLDNIQKIFNYINTQPNINLFMPYITTDINLIDLKLLQYIQQQKQNIIINLNPTNISKAIINYSNFYTLLKENNILIEPNIIINSQTFWNKKQIHDCMQFVQFLVNITYLKFNNKQQFSKYVLPMNNTTYLTNPIIIPYFDKLNNHIFDCELTKEITIDCKNLSFPACSGLQCLMYNGGQFQVIDNKINNITTTKGVNGYLNSKYINSFFQASCTICENKNFCTKGCPGFQFQYSGEPCAKIDSYCQLQSNLLDTLITLYHDFGLFDILFTENNINNIQKQALLNLLSNKGFKEYEYKYI